jgi:hypothetical protein
MTPTALAEFIKNEANASPRGHYKRLIMQKKSGTTKYAHSAKDLKDKFPDKTASLRYDSDSGETERNRQYRAFQIVRRELAREHGRGRGGGNGNTLQPNSENENLSLSEEAFGFAVEKHQVVNQDEQLHPLKRNICWS